MTPGALAKWPPRLCPTTAARPPGPGRRRPPAGARAGRPTRSEQSTFATCRSRVAGGPCGTASSPSRSARSRRPGTGTRTTAPAVAAGDADAVPDGGHQQPGQLRRPAGLREVVAPPAVVVPRRAAGRSEGRTGDDLGSGTSGTGRSWVSRASTRPSGTSGEVGVGVMGSAPAGPRGARGRSRASRRRTGLVAPAAPPSSVLGRASPSLVRRSSVAPRRQCHPRHPGRLPPPALEPPGSRTTSRRSRPATRCASPGPRCSCSAWRHWPPRPGASATTSRRRATRAS